MLHRLISEGTVVSGYALGFGGLTEALAKMSFGNRIGAEVRVKDSDLFNYGNGSILVESKEILELPDFELIGETTGNEHLKVNDAAISIDEAFEANRKHFTAVYPDRTSVCGKVENAVSGENTTKYQGERKEHPVVYLPVFPGTNCDYDMAASFEREGAKVTTSVFCNLTAEDIEKSTSDIASHIDACDILAFSGGFSEGDEPDGSGKFIASVIMNEKVKAAIERLRQRGGLILGICNGFQALVKSGLLPFGKIGELTPDSPTLFHNDINRHISQIVSTRVGSVASPWLEGFTLGEICGRSRACGTASQERADCLPICRCRGECHHGLPGQPQWLH